MKVYGTSYGLKELSTGFNKFEGGYLKTNVTSRKIISELYPTLSKSKCIVVYDEKIYNEHKREMELYNNKCLIITEPIEIDIDIINEKINEYINNLKNKDI